MRRLGKNILVLISILSGPLVAQTRAAGPASETGHVTVYIRNEDVPFQIQYIAQFLAGRIFAKIGVCIEWHNGNPRSSSSIRPIVIELAVAPRNKEPHSLAYALPYEGVHIRVFYGAMAQSPNRALMLANVFAHEITHILQGVVRHSESGIMKANWNIGDIEQMEYGDLAFTPFDIVLIYQGIAARSEPKSAPMTESASDEIADTHD